MAAEVTPPIPIATKTATVPLAGEDCTLYLQWTLADGTDVPGGFSFFSSVEEIAIDRKGAGQLVRPIDFPATGISNLLVDSNRINYTALGVTTLRFTLTSDVPPGGATHYRWWCEGAG